LARFLAGRLGTPQHPSHRGRIEGQGILFYDRGTLMPHIDLWTTRTCLPRYGRGNANTMSWTTLDAIELSFWPLPA